MDSITLLYCPCPDLDCAKDLARQLLAARLIACANILPQMTSLYHWQGKLEEAQECVLILKTKTAHCSAIQDFLQTTHPYEVPCIMQINDLSSNPDFAQWLQTSC